MASQLLKVCRVVSLTNSYVSVLRQSTSLTTKIQIRFRTRWVHRRPIRVISPTESIGSNNPDLDKLKTEREALISNKADEHEIIELDSHYVSDPQRTRSRGRKPVVNSTIQTDTNADEDEFANKKAQQQKKKWPVIHKKTKEEKEVTKRMKMEKSALKFGVPMFTKLEDNDVKLSQAMLIAKSRNRRQKKDLILLEGKRLIKDAIAAGYNPYMVFFSKVEDLKDLEVPEGVEVYKTTYKNISMWSDVVTSPGVVGIFKTPEVEKKEPTEGSLPLTLVCDGVRDPGNLGSILRVAAGVGCSKMVLTTGCVDLWEPKVLRAGAGAHFRLPIVKDIDWSEMDIHIESNSFVVLADSNTDNIPAEEEDIAMSPVPVVPYYALDYSDLGAVTLIIGGETEGLSVCSIKLASASNGVRVNIPLSNTVNSLNAGTALGVIMFEIRRQISLAQQNSRVEASNG